MKNVFTFEEYITEAASIRVDLTPDLFSENSVWGIHKDQKNTGCATWKWNSDLLADLNPEGEIPGETNVVMISVSIFSSGQGYAKVGVTNHLKREPSATVGTNFAFTREDAEKNLKGIAKEAANFLMDAEHFKWISKSLVCNRKKIIAKPKGDFSQIFEKVIEAALKDK